MTPLCNLISQVSPPLADMSGSPGAEHRSDRLGVRAGTKQSAISREERGQISPTFESLHLMNAMGQRLELKAKPMSRDYDPSSS